MATDSGAAAIESEAVAAQLDRRRRDVSSRWGLEHELVLIGAGAPIPVPGRGDLTYPFRAHSEYFYLTDRERPGGVLAFDPQAGWVDFVAPVTRDEVVWEGAAADEAEGVPVSALADWLAERGGRPRGCLGAPIDGVSTDGLLERHLQAGLAHVRRQKDAVELERMRKAEQATRAGFAAIVPMLAPGRSEREVQIELEAEFFRAGADRLAFETIAASGPRTAILHSPPSARRLGAGELVLIDAGGEYRGYASDITRTYPVSGGFTPEQSALHELVRKAGAAATGCCAPGAEFRDVHRAAALVIAEGLIEFGLLRGQPEPLFEQGAVALFFPHGVGHMVGLGVRDAGEILPGREPDPVSFPHLRVDLPLLPGHVVTIEPGVYFVPALLRDPELRARHRGAVDWAVADRMLSFGGIRIENNVLVTEQGRTVLTEDVPILGS